MPTPTSRILMRVALEPYQHSLPQGLRSIQPSDQTELGRLMYYAYLNTVDYEGETIEQAADEVAKTFAGGYGVLNLEASYLFERGGQILSAILVTSWRGQPFIAFCMTHPEAKKHGLARACMKAAMAVLASQGCRELWLAVTRKNDPAIGLYTSLGFEAVRNI